MQRGFTIIEILVTLLIMVVLLTLGTVYVSTLLKNGRDTEREEDIAAIARGLEYRYANGNSHVPGVTKGSYPTVTEFKHMKGTSVFGYLPAQIAGGYVTEVLSGTNDSTLLNPAGQDQFILESETAGNPADSNSQLNTVFSSNTDPYVYSPEDASGNVCTVAPCTSFTLYWRNEETGQRQSLESDRR